MSWSKERLQAILERIEALEQRAHPDDETSRAAMAALLIRSAITEAAVICDGNADVLAAATVALDDIAMEHDLSVDDIIERIMERINTPSV